MFCHQSRQCARLNVTAVLVLVFVSNIVWVSDARSTMPLGCSFIERHAFDGRGKREEG